MDRSKESNKSSRVDSNSEIFRSDWVIRLDKFYYKLFDYEEPDSYELSRFLRKYNIGKVGIVWDNYEFLKKYISEIQLPDTFYWMNIGPLTSSSKFTEQYIYTVEKWKNKGLLHGVVQNSIKGDSVIDFDNIDPNLFTYLEKEEISILVITNDGYLYQHDIDKLDWILDKWKNLKIVISNIGVYGSPAYIDSLGTEKYWLTRRYTLLEFLQLADIHQNLFVEYSSMNDKTKAKELVNYIKRSPNLLYKILPGSNWPMMYNNFNINDLRLKEAGLSNDELDIINSNSIY